MKGRLPAPDPRVSAPRDRWAPAPWYPAAMSGTIADLAVRFALGDDQAAALDAYVSLLAGWRRGNVTGLRTREEILEKLVGDSLALLDVPDLLERAGAGWLDLGAGAGVPGIPLAVALPAAHVVLLDAAIKKCAFLEEAVAAARLAGRAAVVCARSESFAAPGAPGREAYALVLARAVAPLPVLVELAAPLVAPGGVLLASKTAKAMSAEAAAAASAAAQCGLAAGPVVALDRSPLHGSVCAVFHKAGPAPEGIPRREGLAARRPLAGPRPGGGSIC